jgi:hypothetical protein
MEYAKTGGVAWLRGKSSGWELTNMTANTGKIWFLPLREVGAGGFRSALECPQPELFINAVCSSGILPLFPINLSFV